MPRLSLGLCQIRVVAEARVKVKPRRGGDLDNLLLKHEAAWIFNLKTLAPLGLNVYRHLCVSFDTI